MCSFVHWSHHYCWLCFRLYYVYVLRLCNTHSQGSPSKKGWRYTKGTDRETESCINAGTGGQARGVDRGGEEKEKEIFRNHSKVHLCHPRQISCKDDHPRSSEQKATSWNIIFPAPKQEATNQRNNHRRTNGSVLCWSHPLPSTERKS